MDELILTTRKSFSNTLYSVEGFSLLGTCEVQEDAIGCCIEGNTSAMVLCDGIGGLERGDLAAQTAVNTVLHFVSKYNWKENPIAFLNYLLMEANEAVFCLRDENGAVVQGGCTLVIVLTVGRKLYWANVGDSRASLFGKFGMKQLTVDHNYTEQLGRRLGLGEITREEYEAGMAKGAALTSYLGMGVLKEFFVCSEPIILDRDEVVLVESDGLYKLLNNEEKLRIVSQNVRRLESMGEGFLREAKGKVENYQDNTSMLLFRIK